MRTTRMPVQRLPTTQFLPGGDSLRLAYSPVLAVLLTARAFHATSNSPKRYLAADDVHFARSAPCAVTGYVAARSAAA